LLARIATTAQGTLKVGDPAMLFVRPEALNIAPDITPAPNRFAAMVKHEEFEGQIYNVFLEGSEGKEIKMSLVNIGTERQSAEGMNLTLEYVPEQAVVLPAGELASE
jgi:spermidine/putrescine transport system ATP-binding protein